jgi:hypothetical protein
MERAHRRRGHLLKECFESLLESHHQAEPLEQPDDFDALVIFVGVGPQLVSEDRDVIGFRVNFSPLTETRSTSLASKFDRQAFTVWRRAIPIRPPLRPLTLLQQLLLTRQN